jgi:hypothetical protein
LLNAMSKQILLIQRLRGGLNEWRLRPHLCFTLLSISLHSLQIASINELSTLLQKQLQKLKVLDLVS